MLPFGGHYGWISWQKYKVRKEVKHRMKSEIDKSELIFFAFSLETTQKKLKWKHALEFEYNGEMYDIIHKRETTDSAFYWVWWDHEETHLNKQLAEIISQLVDQNSQNQKSQQVYISLLKSPYLLTSFPFSPNVIVLESHKLIDHQSSCYISVSYSPTIPPPKKNHYLLV